MGQNLAGTFSVGSLTTSLKGLPKGHRGYGVLTHSQVAFMQKQKEALSLQKKNSFLCRKSLVQCTISDAIRIT